MKNGTSYLNIRHWTAVIERAKKVPLELILALLPGGVFEPLVDMKSTTLDTVLKLLAFPSSIFQQLCMVMDLLLGGLDSDFLTLLGLSQNLLRRDLHGRGILVFNLFM